MCGCADLDCATFTARAPADLSPKRQVETVPVNSLAGMVNVDVLDGEIVGVEVLYRPEVRVALEVGFARDRFAG